ncbi:MAG: cob(I)yrinic acid a,c-diamide adenosyltransferase [Alphaproteobacteria bacterium]|nr:cob(I)yrinic acid a,c-diamide adenosyltransferase [Alphaproteobacteria bacterium]
MVKLNKIYTRTGDDGTTGLVHGQRRRKYDVRIRAFGAVDEANAALGLARLAAKGMTKIETTVQRLQNDLFDLGADLATPGPDNGRKTATLRTTQTQVDWLEQTIDQFNEKLPALESFTLPGGTALGAHLHMARTIVRRAERDAVELATREPGINPVALRYLNRLSDLLFVLSRVANDDGRKDVLWIPGRDGGANGSG